MKDFTEIRQELTALEVDLDRLSQRAGALGRKVAALEAAGTGQVAGLDLGLVDKLARRLPYKAHPLKKAKPDSAQAYLKAVLSVRLVESASRAEDLDFLVFCQWLLLQSGLKTTLPRLLEQGGEVNELFFKSLPEMLRGGLEEPLLLDMMMAVGLLGADDDTSLVYITQLAQYLEIGEERAAALALLARCSLQQSAEKLTRQEAVQISGLLRSCGYYDAGSLLKTVNEAVRVILFRAEKDSRELSYDWKVSNRAVYYFKAGTLLAIYTVRASGRRRKITTPYDGWLFRFSINKVEYGVLSTGVDDKEEIKAWVKEKEDGIKAWVKRKEEKRK